MSEKKKILVIDDELTPRYTVQQVLKDRYNVFTAEGGKEGLEFMAQNPVDLVVLDIRMPNMDGITVLDEIKKRYTDTEVVLLTAYASLESARKAVRLGAFDYLMKPFDKDDLLKVVERGLQRKRTHEEARLEHEELVDKTKYLEEQIVEIQRDLTKSYEGTVKALLLAIDAKDHYTSTHSEHVAMLSYLVAKALGLSENVRDRLKQITIIHDIGKIGVDEIILKKNGILTPEEFSEMKKHPEIGARIVKAVPFLEEALPIILYHHERFDGKGYPQGLRGEEIPLIVRIVTVSDAVDAMMRDRPYRKKLPIDKLSTELKENAGSQFDPMIVDVILREELLSK